MQTFYFLKLGAKGAVTVVQVEAENQNVAKTKLPKGHFVLLTTVEVVEIN
jgi:hypothetical protein